MRPARRPKRGLDRVGILVGGQLGEVAAGQDVTIVAIGEDSELLGDRRGGRGVVTGDHLHVDPGGVTVRDRFDRRLARGIEHRLQPGQRERTAQRLDVELGRLLDTGRGRGQDP